MIPKFRLITDGQGTYAELDGKSIGAGIESISYSHDAKAGGRIKLELQIDLSSFKFAEDGTYDRIEERIKEHEPLVEERLA